MLNPRKVRDQLIGSNSNMLTTRPQTQLPGHYLEVDVLGPDVGLSHQHLGDVIVGRLKNLEASGHVVG